MKSESTNDTYQGLFGLDRLPKELKTLNWAASFIAVICIAFINYSRIVNTLPQMPLRTTLSWLAWISPTCIAVAWLRLTGVKWQRAILLFIFVPIVFTIILLILRGLLILFMDD